MHWWMQTVLAHYIFNMNMLSIDFCQMKLQIIDYSKVQSPQNPQFK